MSYKDKWKIEPEQIEQLFAGVQSIAKRFIITNFRMQGFQDGGLKAWKPKKKNDGRNILVGKSNPHMIQSFHFNKVDKTSTRITNTKKYSGLHNNGVGKMPERRMIGESATLDGMISKDINSRLKKVIKASFPPPVPKRTSSSVTQIKTGQWKNKRVVKYNPNL